MDNGGYNPRINPGTAFPERPQVTGPSEPAEFGSDQWVEDSLRYIHQIAKSPALLEAANSYRKPSDSQEQS